ncbi:MAG: SPOR domain-containing protein [candidate division Zixibacteria bacterium]|nr:SPOR domain-containing protein [candidate division Zixibacteria bacterium]
MKLISRVMTFYFPIFAVLLALTVIAIGCADSEEELAKLEQRRLDSIATEDSLAAIVRAEQQRVQDSIRTVEDSLTALAEAEEAAKMPSRKGLVIEPGVFTVQIASYDNSEDAQPFYGKLSGEGLDPYIIEVVALFGDEERLVFRLRFGKYDSKDEAHNRGSEVALRHELDYWVDNYKR